MGYVIGEDGVKADPDKIKALIKFPEPKNLTELRSFLGLANQLSNFTKELSGLTEPLRDLLKTKNHFQWTELHEQAFTAIKEHLSRTPTLSNFDPGRETEVYTDASRTKGLGYVIR